MVYQKHTLWKVETEQYRPTSSIHREEPDHLPGRRMGPLSITGRIGKDHWQMEGCCDIGGPGHDVRALLAGGALRAGLGCEGVGGVGPTGV